MLISILFLYFMIHMYVLWLCVSNTPQFKNHLKRSDSVLIIGWGQRSGDQKSETAQCKAWRAVFHLQWPTQAAQCHLPTEVTEPSYWSPGILLHWLFMSYPFYKPTSPGVKRYLPPTKVQALLSSVAFFLECTRSPIKLSRIWRNNLPGWNPEIQDCSLSPSWDPLFRFFLWKFLYSEGWAHSPWADRMMESHGPNPSCIKTSESTSPACREYPDSASSLSCLALREPEDNAHWYPHSPLLLSLSQVILRWKAEDRGPLSSSWWRLIEIANRFFGGNKKTYQEGKKGDRMALVCSLLIPQSMIFPLPQGSLISSPSPAHTHTDMQTHAHAYTHTHKHICTVHRARHNSLTLERKNKIFLTLIFHPELKNL